MDWDALDPSHKISETQWKQIEALVPKKLRSSVSSELVIEGAYWVLKKGGEWKQLPPAIFGAHKTLRTRFKVWMKRYPSLKKSV